MNVSLDGTAVRPLSSTPPPIFTRMPRGCAAFGMGIPPAHTTAQPLPGVRGKRGLWLPGRRRPCVPFPHQRLLMAPVSLPTTALGTLPHTWGIYLPASFGETCTENKQTRKPKLEEKNYTKPPSFPLVSDAQPAAPKDGVWNSKHPHSTGVFSLLGAYRSMQYLFPQGFDLRRFGSQLSVEGEQLLGQLYFGPRRRLSQGLCHRRNLILQVSYHRIFLLCFCFQTRKATHRLLQPQQLFALWADHGCRLSLSGCGAAGLPAPGGTDSWPSTTWTCSPTSHHAHVPCPPSSSHPQAQSPLGTVPAPCWDSRSDTQRFGRLCRLCQRPGQGWRPSHLPQHHLLLREEIRVVSPRGRGSPHTAFTIARDAGRDWKKAEATAANVSTRTGGRQQPRCSQHPPLAYLKTALRLQLLEP